MQLTFRSPRARGGGCFEEARTARAGGDPDNKNPMPQASKPANTQRPWWTRQIRLTSGAGRGFPQEECKMGLILLLVVLVLLFGGGGFYLGAPYHYYGGGLGTILIIVIVVLLLRG